MITQMLAMVVTVNIVAANCCGFDCMERIRSFASLSSISSISFLCSEKKDASEPVANADSNNAAIAKMMAVMLPIVGVCTLMKSDTATAVLNAWFKKQE